MLNVETKECDSCLRGYYQPNEGQLSCRQCPKLTSTHYNNSKSKGECIGMYFYNTFYFILTKNNNEKILKHYFFQRRQQICNKKIQKYKQKMLLQKKESLPMHRIFFTILKDSSAAK